MEKINNLVKEGYERKEYEHFISEKKTFIDNVCFSNKVERIHGTTTLGADLYADSSFEAIVTYHIESWKKVEEDAVESDPEIVDVKYYEGGWM